MWLWIAGLLVGGGITVIIADHVLTDRITWTGPLILASGVAVTLLEVFGGG